jgi:two-component system KDP operon response regulator KdpE
METAARENEPIMNNEPLILAVDDDPGILRLVKLELSSQGFRVNAAADGMTALKMAEEEAPDLVVMDIMMPEMTGLEVMERLRAKKHVPVLLLTGRDQDMDKIQGFEAGADDYLPKPFNPEELSARVRAILRRSAVPADPATEMVVVGDVAIDLRRRLVKKHGQVVTLTRTEWMLLQHLAENPGRTILNSELLSRVWGAEYRDDLQYLRVWVSRLRAKLETDPGKPSIIRTLQGVGYRLELSDEAPKSQDGNSTADSVTLVGSH